MAFTPEDGTGISGANSFTTLAAAVAFWDDRGAPAAWASAGGGDRQKALVKATDYLNSLDRFPYRGTKATRAQRLQWPRVGATERNGSAIPDNEVPVEVAEATAAVAALILAGVDLQPVLKRGGAIRRKRTDVLETEFFDDAPTRDTVTQAMDALGHLLRSGMTGSIVPVLKQPDMPPAFVKDAFDTPGGSI